MNTGTHTFHQQEESKTQQSSQYGQPNPIMNPLIPQSKFQSPKWRHKNVSTQHEETRELKRRYFGNFNTDIDEEKLSDYF